MRLLSLLVTTSILLSTAASHKFLKPKGPPCPKGDGLYAVGCSNKYLECVNDVEFERSCPEGLYFDRLLSRCDTDETNALCNRVKDSRKMVIPIRQKAITIACNGRKNGDYAVDEGICSQVYYQCANDRFFMRKCPYNLVFSPYKRDCTYESECNESDFVKRRPASAYASPTYDADNFEVTAHEVTDDSGPKGVNCANLGDSFMSDLACSPYFWQCSNGKLFRKSCPSGLIYVLSQNLCDFAHAVKGCPEYDGSAPSYEQTEPPRPQTPPTTTQAYEPVYTEPTTKPTPVYVPPYVQPTTKPAPIYVPPTTTTKAAPVYAEPSTKSSTVYIRPITTTTTTKAYVPPVTTTAAPEYVPYAAAPASPVVHDAGEIEILAKCQNKEDGFYEIIPCHKNFLACTNGGGRLIACAEQLVFDNRISSCEFLEKCKAPRTQEAVPQLYNHGGLHEKKPEEVKVDFDCSDKEDGHYFKEACVNEFFLCQDRRAFLKKCPADLVYNKAIKTCDYAHNCEKYYMEPTQLYSNEVADDSIEVEVEQTTIASTSAPYTTKPAPIYTTQPPTTKLPTKRPIYTLPPTTTKAYQQPTTSKAYETTKNLPYTTGTPAVAKDNFTCSHLKEGNYASGNCKSVFYICAHNQLTAIHCPGTLKYNPYNDQCDYAENNVDCRGNDQPLVLPSVPAYAQTSTTAPTTTTAAPTTAAAPVYEAPVYASVESYQSTRPSKYFAYCERLADGNYGEPCQKHFFQCANFETNVINCRAGLFYSLKQDRCDYPQNVEGCPEYVSTTTPAQDEITTSGYTTKQYPNIDYTTPVPGPVDTTPIAQAFSCYGRADGIYALPYCSGDYVQCMAGRSLIAACAAGLFYSERSGLCDYKENVPICRLRKGSDSIVNNACIGKSDGYYSAGCSAHYFSCIGEETRKMVCPTTLKFSERKGVCGYPSDVEECGIAPPTGNAPPAVPSDFCTIRPNGLHAFGQCSSHYVVCENYVAIAGTCAAPLVFNEINQLCDYKSNNKECGSDYVPPAQDSYAAVEKTTKSYETVYVPTTKPYYPSSTTTTTTAPASDAPEITTTQAYTQPTTTTTTTTAAPTTTTTVYTRPTTTTTTTTAAPTTEVYTTTTTEAYTQPTTTTTLAPADDETTVTDSEYSTHSPTYYADAWTS